MKIIMIHVRKNNTERSFVQILSFPQMVTFCQIVVEYNQDIDIDAAQQLCSDL